MSGRNVEHAGKMRQMEAHLSGLGLSRWTYAPPLYRLLWRLGVPVTPPLFASFAALALVQGTFFGLFWGLFMWLTVWAQQGMSAALAALLSVCVASTFGLCMAAIYRARAAKLGLPAWSDYAVAPGPATRAD